MLDVCDVTKDLSLLASAEFDMLSDEDNDEGPEGVLEKVASTEDVSMYDDVEARVAEEATVVNVVEFVIGEMLDDRAERLREVLTDEITVPEISLGEAIGDEEMVLVVAAVEDVLDVARRLELDGPRVESAPDVVASA